MNVDSQTLEKELGSMFRPGGSLPDEVWQKRCSFLLALTWLHAGVIAWRFNERALEQIKKQAAELEEANRLQADFTAMIAHDLRSPVSSVFSTAGLLQEGFFGAVNEEQKKWLASMQTTSRAILDIVNDFLDVSKIEAGRLDLIGERIDLYKLIQGSLESYLLLAQAKKVALTSRLDPQLPLIYADGRRIEQILANFIANAIKFTPSGGVIEVGAGRTDGDLKMWVKDSGVGIPPDEIGQLFEK